MLNNCHLSRLIAEQAQKYGDREALRYRDYAKNCWVPVSWKQFAAQVGRVSRSLLELGVRVQENIGVFSQNKPECLYTDFGAYGVRAVTIPFYATSSVAQVAYMVNDAEVRFVFVGEQQQYDTAFNVMALCPTLEKLIIFDREVKKNPADHLSVYFDEFLALGDGAGQTEELETRKKAASFDDIANILYTSGTTGNSKGVILTTGGFASDVEMRKQYNPNYDERFMTTATLASTGDGIKMAQAAGAGVRDMEWIQVYPTCNPLTGIISYVANSRFDGAILVNTEGQRFIDEMGRRDVISNAILDQPEGFAYLVWGQEVETVGNMTQLHTQEFSQWQKDDLLYVADSIEDAAEHYGIDPAALRATVDAYNASIADGVDEDFNRGGTLRTLSEGPFYIQKVVPSAHHTMGGLTINTDAQVLDTEGNPIEGLYAAGEVTGGIHGTNRLGGNAITDLVVFGRIAARNAVK